MGPAELTGIATGILAISGTIVAVTRYITQLQFRLGQERLEESLKHSKERHTELESRHKELLRELATARRIGTAGLVKKADIDDELLTAMRTLGAQASSILVRGPSLGSVSEESALVFLSIFGPAALALKRKRVPISESIAGAVFRTGTPYLASDAYKDSRFYNKADAISKYKTEDILTCPLKYREEIVGVMQFLNKEGGNRFGPDDISVAETFAPSLSAKVADFIRSADNFDILGVAPAREAEEATVMFCDLTNSALLFDAMNAASAIDLINTYLERVCDVALSHGATIDKFLGDGVMLRFNVPRRLIDHTSKALKAALEIQATFEDLKERWIRGGYLVRGIYSRVAIACGPVYQAVVGHPQYQEMTIMGKPVNTAANLCDAALHDQNVIVIDEHAGAKLGGKISARQFAAEHLGNAIQLTQSAYGRLHIE